MHFRNHTVSKVFAGHHRAPHQAAFTLIELLIVVTLTVVLAAVAGSFYQTHTIRNQVSDGLTLAASGKALIEDAYRADSQAPADWLDLGLSDDSKSDYGEYVVSIEVVNGRIDTTFGNMANTSLADTVLSLTPYETAAGEVVWRCGQSAVPESEEVPLEPLGTGGGGRAAVFRPSSVPERFLPAGCK